MKRIICGELEGYYPEPGIDDAKVYLKFIGRDGEPQEHYFLDDYQGYYAFRMEVAPPYDYDEKVSGPWKPERPMEFWVRGKDDEFFLAENEQGPINGWEAPYTDPDWLHNKNEMLTCFEDIGEYSSWTRALLKDDGTIDWDTLEY